MTPNDLPIREPDQIRQDAARKLRSVQVSDHFQAILGCLLEEDWTTPRLNEMVITPDGHILGRCDGEEAFKAFLGASEDLIKCRLFRGQRGGGGIAVARHVGIF